MEMLDTRIMDYAVVALRMLYNRYDEKLEEEYFTMLDTALGFIPEDKINAIQTSGEIPDIEKLE